MGELNIATRPSTLPIKMDIVGLMVQDVDVGVKISTAIPCLMLEKVLMSIVVLDLGLRPSLLLPTIQLILVDHQVFIVMVMT